MPFISVYCPIAQARTSNVMLNRSESGHPCLVPDLRDKAFSLSQLNLLAVGFCFFFFFLVDVLYQVEEVPVYSYLAQYFNHERVLDFIKYVF